MNPWWLLLIVPSTLFVGIMVGIGIGMEIGWACKLTELALLLFKTR